MPLGASFFEDVPLVGFMYLIFTCMPGGFTVGDSGLCCCLFPFVGSLASSGSVWAVAQLQRALVVSGHLFDPLLLTVREYYILYN